MCTCLSPEILVACLVETHNFLFQEQVHDSIVSAVHKPLRWFLGHGRSATPHRRVKLAMRGQPEEETTKIQGVQDLSVVLLLQVNADLGSSLLLSRFLDKVFMRISIGFAVIPIVEPKAEHFCSRARLRGT